MNYYIKSKAIEKDVLHLTLQAKSQAEILSFYPGQYIALSFGSGLRKSPYRCFSITSTPESGVIELGIRIGGKFTQRLSRLSENSDIRLLGPFGDFCIDTKADEYIVMIAAGIGITPYMSMIRSNLSKGDKTPIFLLYSSRYSSAMPFIDELTKLSKKHGNFKIIAFITGSEDKKLEIPVVKSAIDQSHLQKIVNKDEHKNTYFICGPKDFNKAIYQKLETLGIIEERIITESFSESSQIKSINGNNLNKITYLASAALVVFGIFSIAFLDLLRYIPKHVTASTKNSSTGSNTNTATGSSTTTSPTSGSSTFSSTQYNNYQPPTSRVS